MGCSGAPTANLDANIAESHPHPHPQSFNPQSFSSQSALVVLHAQAAAPADAADVALGMEAEGMAADTEAEDMADMAADTARE